MNLVQTGMEPMNTQSQIQYLNWTTAAYYVNSDIMLTSISDLLKLENLLSNMHVSTKHLMPLNTINRAMKFSIN